MLHTMPAPSPFRALLDWYRRQRMAHELSALDAAEAARLADDLKINIGDLVEAAGQSDDEIALMDRMMALRGIDRDKLAAEMPAVIREMSVTCAKCTCKGDCRYELDHGVTAEEADNFCPNAETMKALIVPRA